jgi:hypothetical protein
MSPRWLSFFPLLYLALGVGTVLSLYTKTAIKAPLPEIVAHHQPPLPKPSETFDFVYSSPLLLGVVFAVITCLVWLLLLRNKTEKSSERARRYPNEVELSLAKDIEIEILRRTALRREAR